MTPRRWAFTYAAAATGAAALGALTAAAIVTVRERANRALGDAEDDWCTVTEDGKAGE